MAISLPKGKKAWVVFGVGGAAVVTILVIARRKSAASSASTTSATDTTATDQIDPLTGDVAGSAQDQADLAALQSDGLYGSSGFLPNTGYGSAPVGSTIPGAGGFATNGEWMQQAETDLSGFGVDVTTLAAALGKYLTGQAVTSDQAALIDQAIAAEGYPPTSGPGGYPPNIKDLAGGGPGPGSGNVTVPNVVGHSSHVAVATIQKAGLVAVLSPPTPAGQDGIISAESPKAGSSVAKGSSVTLTNVLHHGKKG